MFTGLLLCLAATAPALAHFTLNYPPPRGPFVAQQEVQFCSAYPTGARSPFPLDGGVIDISNHHPSAQVGAWISFDSNPTEFVQFNHTDNGTEYGMLHSFIAMNWQGDICFPVDVASLGVAGVVNGTLATIQVQYNGGDGALFDCADIILIANYTVPANITCTNSTAATNTSSASSVTSLPTSVPSASANTTGGGSSGALSIETSAATKVVGVLVVVAVAIAVSL